MSLEQILLGEQTVIIKQRKELFELVGFETRNKYSILRSDQSEIGFAAEQQKGIVGLLLRQMFGHWRSFTLHLFDNQRQPVVIANHPFRFLFPKLEATDPSGRVLGSIQYRFSILHKHFDILDNLNRVIFSVRSPIWRIWTFTICRGEDGKNNECAQIKKVWGGILREGFTDADTFELSYNSSVTGPERILLLIAALYVDLIYFERKAR